jgi:cytochrome c peroxidase
MKVIAKYPFCIFLLSLFSLFGILQCEKAQKPIENDLISVKKNIFETNRIFLSQINELESLVAKDTEEKILQQKFDALRITYKKMEWAVEYFLPTTARFINGPALPEIEMEEHTVLEPEGLQVIEEMMYPYDAENKDELLRILKKLTNKSNTVKANFAVISVSRDQVFDAVRQQVFRISSLGIAGFDTPVSGNFLREMPFALESVKSALKMIHHENSDGNSLQKISQQIDAAVLELKKNPDKNSFDYIGFIPEYLNKISEALLEFKKEENIPDVEVTTALKKNASSFYAKNAFDVDAFVPGKEYAMSDEKVQLGKQLFNDKILSNNNTRSCASCHDAKKAFTDGEAKSMSLENVALARNTPSLNYSSLQHGQFWDMRKDDLEGQSSDVITNKEEMHGDMQTIIAKINKDSRYRQFFTKIFKSKNVESWQLQNVLASYIRSLATFNSDFDAYMRGDQNALSEDQKKGFNLFMGKAQCAICHFLPIFNGTVPPNYSKTEQEVLGIATDGSNKKADSDPGRGKFHQTVEFLQRSFKTPTLRNIAKTAPYMHNGGYKTLEEVMKFYNEGGGKGLGLAVENQTLSDSKLNLTDKEMKQIISFLNSLTDR